MTAQYESADLLLKLYELRREAALRDARVWFVERFHPDTAQQVFDTWMGKESAAYRMVTTYWNMAAALVNHGAIDAQMFADLNTEHVAVYAKLQPFLADLRVMSGNPGYLRHLERVIERTPDAQARVERMHKYLRLKRAQFQKPRRRGKAR